MEMIKRSGQQGVPVIATAEDVIVGFDQARLGRVADKYSTTPKRAPLGLLGADAQDYLNRHEELKKQYPDGQKGVYIGEVHRGSVAEAAGVKAGDIIVAVANKKVTNLRELNRIIDSVSAGEAVSVRYMRGGLDSISSLQF